MEDKRLFQRILFSHDATLQAAGNVWTTQILDLSLHGFLCTEPTNFNHDLNQKVTLIIKLNDQQSITIEAKLVHHQNNTLGLETVHIDIDSISELKRLVELNLGDDVLLHRELINLAK